MQKHNWGEHIFNRRRPGNLACHETWQGSRRRQQHRCVQEKPACDYFLCYSVAVICLTSCPDKHPGRPWLSNVARTCSTAFSGSSSWPSSASLLNCRSMLCTCEASLASWLNSWLPTAVRMIAERLEWSTVCNMEARPSSRLWLHQNCTHVSFQDAYV